MTQILGQEFVAFNRTSMESKRNQGIRAGGGRATFNRTSMESKPQLLVIAITYDPTLLIEPVWN